MKLPLTLSLYIGRQFVTTILFALLALCSLVVLIDGIELIRRASSRENVPMMAVMSMAFLRMPYQMDQLLPFAVLVGGMVALAKLTRTHELVVARAAGVSVWQFLMPALISAMALGVFFVAVLSPISSVMLLRFEHLESRYFSNRPSLMAISSSGLWLRQVEENQSQVAEHIIYAPRISQNDMSFSNVIIFSFDPSGRFIERLDAERAVLDPGFLRLEKAVRSLPGMPPEKLSRYALPTDLKLSHIQDSFASPETMSFWTLPSFIGMLEKAGFSALRHRLYWQSMLAKPALLCGMILVAALFSLRLPRRGRLGIMAVAGVIVGFSFHFFTDIVHALGAAGGLPVTLAAWAPAGIMLVIGTAMLLHLEDG